MKTIEEKDLITWANREKAVIGKEYYFAHTLIGMQKCIENSSYIETLEDIDENDISSPFIYHEEDYVCNFACILPVEVVKDIEPEKKYRACKNVRELYELVSNSKYKIDEKECIYWLVGGNVIHFRDKQFKKERYEIITSIRCYANASPLISIATAIYELDDLFDNYEIEINGEWRPFGVLEN